jgi:hypothetical protein
VENLILFCLVTKFTIAQSEKAGMVGVENPVREMVSVIKGKRKRDGSSLSDTK